MRNNNSGSIIEQSPELLELNKRIEPFFVIEIKDNLYSLLLEVGEYKAELFKTREDEGALGNGYDWEALSEIFIHEKMKHLKTKIDLDSEADMYCAYSKDIDIIKEFALGFKEACEDNDLIEDLFARAEID